MTLPTTILQHGADKEIARTIIVGISGPSSSGKTTLARLLRSIFTPVDDGASTLTFSDVGLVRSFVIHEDDFYKPDDKYWMSFLTPSWSFSSCEFPCFSILLPFEAA